MHLDGKHALALPLRAARRVMRRVFDVISSAKENLAKAEPARERPAKADPGKEDLIAMWDRYAREWRPQEGANRLGDEWRRQEGFVAALGHALDHVCRPGTKARALEIGAGGGRISRECVRLAGGRLEELVLSDTSAAMLAHCKSNVPASAGLRFVQTSGVHLDEFADGTFAFVYSHDVFVHFEDIDVFNYLRHIHRVLAPNGICLVSLHDPVKSFKYFTTVTDEHRGTVPGGRGPNRVRFLPESLMRACAEAAGFADVQVDRGHFALWRLTKAA